MRHTLPYLTYRVLDNGKVSEKNILDNSQWQIFRKVKSSYIVVFWVTKLSCSQVGDGEQGFGEQSASLF